jgi:hypothetical protein
MRLLSCLLRSTAETRQQLLLVSVFVYYPATGTDALAVYSADEQAGGAALVHALLEDPFSSEVDSAIIHQRWEGKRDLSRLDIQCVPLHVPVPFCSPFARGTPAPNPTAVPPRSSEDEPHTPAPPAQDIYLKSTFLSSLSVPFQLSELRPSLYAPSPDTLRVLYTADLPIIVVNPLTTPLASLLPTAKQITSTVFPYPLPSHALLVIASPSPASTPDSLRIQLSTTLGIPSSNILFVDPFRAQAAAHAFRSTHPSALNVQRYHDDALGSGLSALRTKLSALLNTGAPSPLDQLRARKAHAILQAAIGMMHREIALAEHDMLVATATARELRATVNGARAEAARAILGAEALDVNTGHEGALSGHVVRDEAAADQVQLALAEADRMVRPVVEQLWPHVLPKFEVRGSGSGTRLFGGPAQRLRAFGRSLVPRVSLTALGSADDVAWVVGQAVQRAWVGGVERTVCPLQSFSIAAGDLTHASSSPPSLHSDLRRSISSPTHSHAFRRSRRPSALRSSTTRSNSSLRTLPSPSRPLRPSRRSPRASSASTRGRPRHSAAPHKRSPRARPVRLVPA